MRAMYKKAATINKIAAVMKGFATRDEIAEEINYFMEVEGMSLKKAEKTLIANIDCWARWNPHDGNDVVWERMEALGIEIDSEYCTK